MHKVGHVAKSRLYCQKKVELSKVDHNAISSLGLNLNLNWPMRFDVTLVSDTKKEDTFGQDDKDWDVYKEIVS